MAEAVGVVASGLAFAEVVLKISKHVFTLKHMWEEFKEIPESVRLLVGDVELLSQVLKEMEADINGPGLDGVSLVDGIGSLILATCRGALDVLSISVEDIFQELKAAKRMKRAVVKAKLVLMKDFWLKTEQRLNRVVWLLGVAQQHWMISLAKRHNSRKSSNLPLPPTSEVLDPIGDETAHRKKLGAEPHRLELVQSSGRLDERRRQQMAEKHLGGTLLGSVGFDSAHSADDGAGNRYYIQFKPPNWLTRKSWSILYSVSSFGFNINLRAHSVIPHTSLVVQCAELGDVQGLLALFNNGLASPFDVDEYGRGLLEIAMQRGQEEAMSTLIDLGLDFGACFDPKSRSSIFYAMSESISSRGWSFVHRAHQLALSQSAYDDYADEWLLPAHSFWKYREAPSRILTPDRARAFLEHCPDTLKFFLPHLRPGHYLMPAIDRLHLLMRFPTVADCLRYLLWHDGKVKEDDIRALEDIEFPLLKFIAVEYSDRTHSGENASKVQEWRQLTREILKATTSLHSHIGDEAIRDRTAAWFIYPGTALSAVIRGTKSCNCPDCEGGRTLSPWRRETERALRYWLQDLRDSGIDLIEYGRGEKRIFTETEWIRSLRFCFTIGELSHEGCKLADFSYGPEPKDWKFEWELERDEIAGEFWEMIEDPTRSMVGAWID
ncbi:hypothetical protein NLG97_g3376 [Lecanicillium saksenae]|uniref:Uncharacterized protein n=1 Tax=Lecanicillium saksenae TaxID=468837 RepID=A0ACC1QZZ9_9HYPO|nr:hypothetical protein NLG97_g3376 [Lecanicillium saksenae]